MTSSINVHVGSVMFRWLSPVRSLGPVVHLTPRATLTAPRVALCGEGPPATARGTRRWRLVHGAGAPKRCAACFADACRTPSRVDW